MDGKWFLCYLLPTNQFDKFVLAFHVQMFALQLELAWDKLIIRILDKYRIEKYNYILILKFYSWGDQGSAPVIYLLCGH